MNADLNYLIEVSKIDKEASKKEPEIEAINNELQSKIRQKHAFENELDELAVAIKKAKVDIANMELVISEHAEKIAQIEKKKSGAKSERELRALDAENGLAEEKITYSNGEITRLEGEINSYKQKEGEIAAKIKDLDSKIQKVEVEVERKIEAINKELKEQFIKKDKIAKNIDNKILVFYEKIRKWAKDTSVVPLRKQACGGCFIRINDNIYSQLIKSEEITTCPHCGRILFIEQ